MLNTLHVRRKPGSKEAKELEKVEAKSVAFSDGISRWTNPGRETESVHKLTDNKAAVPQTRARCLMIIRQSKHASIRMKGDKKVVSKLWMQTVLRVWGGGAYDR